MKQRLCEMSGLTAPIKPDGNVLPNVKVLGLDSKNKRRYLPEAVRKALPLYENVSVYLNHPGEEDASRPVEALIGRVKNARIVPEGIRGDLHLNPKHPHTGQILWLAENEPTAVGLSHNAFGDGQHEGGVFVVREISEVRSVDLVTEPATTKGLFESLMNYEDDDKPMHEDDEVLPELTPATDDAPLDEPAEGGDSMAYAKKEASRIVGDAGLSAAEKKAKLWKLLAYLHDDEELEEGEEDDEEKPVEESLKAENKRLKAENAAYKLKESRALKRDEAKKLLVSKGFRASEITDELLESLMDESKAKQTALIESWTKLLGGKRPKSGTPPTPASEGDPLDNFLNSILVEG